MLLFSHPTVTPTVHHTARALSRAGVLAEFWTFLAARDRLELRQVPAGALAGPARESLGGGMPYPPGGPGSAGHADRMSTSRSAALSLDEAMSVRVDSEPFRGVYAYEDGARATFRAAGRHGLLRIYDLPLGHWRGEHDILLEEAASEPAWAATLRAPSLSAAALSRTESELEEADLVLVGSSFALQTIEQTLDLASTLAVVPPSAPCALSARVAHRRPGTSPGPLKVLFAGPLDQRAGLSYLFDACRKLGPSVALTVIGEAPSVECAPLARELGGVRWLPRCDAEALQFEMATHDVFLFPAIFDGHGQLLLTAMAMGLPIVSTPHSAAPDLIRDGEEGFIIPVRSTSMIMEKLDLLRRDPSRREQMSWQARARASSYTWDRFEQTLAANVAAALGRR